MWIRDDTGGRNAVGISSKSSCYLDLSHIDINLLIDFNPPVLIQQQCSMQSIKMLNFIPLLQQ